MDEDKIDKNYNIFFWCAVLIIIFGMIFLWKNNFFLVKDGAMHASQYFSLTRPVATSTIFTNKIQTIEKRFIITADRKIFSPFEIVVMEGEGVQITFRAEDAPYDMEIAQPIGAYLRAEKGETKIVGFVAGASGTYSILCKELCYGRQIAASLIVLPKVTPESL